MCTLRTAAFAAGSLSVCLSLTGISRASIIISEIMYNPDSSEAAPNDVEWVEIFNPGPVPVSIANWSLRDEDGISLDVISPGSVIGAGTAVVLSSASSISSFQDAWGTGFTVHLLSFANLSGLNNSPSASNEILQLIDASANVVDTVNFDDSGDWPSDSPDGRSIFLLPTGLSSNPALANDQGLNWARSEIGIQGARQNVATPAFNGQDIGSPGFVPVAAVPEPNTLVIMSLSLLCSAIAVGCRRSWQKLRKQPVAGR